jgi:hypothetical protein
MSIAVTQTVTCQTGSGTVTQSATMIEVSAAVTPALLPARLFKIYALHIHVSAH